METNNKFDIPLIILWDNGFPEIFRKSVEDAAYSIQSITDKKQMIKIVGSEKIDSARFYSQNLDNISSYINRSLKKNAIDPNILIDAINHFPPFSVKCSLVILTERVIFNGGVKHVRFSNDHNRTSLISVSGLDKTNNNSKILVEHLFYHEYGRLISILKEKTNSRIVINDELTCTNNCSMKVGMGLRDWMHFALNCKMKKIVYCEDCMREIKSRL